MKKIFIGISATILVFVVVLLGVLTGIKKNIGFAIEEPDFLIVYNKSTQSIGGKTYHKDQFEDEKDETFEEDKKVFDEVLDKFTKMTTLSLFQLALNNKNLNYKIEYDSENYATYDSLMKKENIAIEIMYKSEKNLVVYDSKNPRVIPYYSLLIIIPPDGKFNEFIVYSSMTNAENREDYYKQSTPIILKGDSKKLVDYVNKM